MMSVKIKLTFCFTHGKKRGKRFEDILAVKSHDTSI